MRFALVQVLANQGFVNLPFRRNNQGNGLTNRLGGTVAKQAFGSLVPTGNDALRGFANDRILG
jgi:hypothetical protein